MNDKVLKKFRRLLILWERYGNRILRLAVVLLATAAAFRLLHESFRLVLGDPQINGPNDLRNFQNAMKGLFAGQPIYRELHTSPYPPASYAIFWPLLGWLDLTQARLFWTASVIAVLAWIIVLIIRESKANSPLERILVALLLLSMNGTGVTIGNGQLGLHILAALLTALVLIRQQNSSILQQCLAALLLLLALAKPTISAPFIWMVMFAPHGKRILFLTGIGYLIVSWIAVSYQHEPAVSVFQSWFTRASTVALEKGYGNLHALLSSVHLNQWMTPASLVVFGLLGFWVYLHRSVDSWLVIGVTAITARFWAYHRYYDDVLIILPMICLLRIAKASGSGNARGWIAGTLLAMISFLNLARLHNISALRFELMTTANVTLWLLTIAFLLHLAKRENVETELHLKSLSIVPKDAR